MLRKWFLWLTSFDFHKSPDTTKVIIRLNKLISFDFHKRPGTMKVITRLNKLISFDFHISSGNMKVITRLNKVTSVDFAKRPGIMKYILYSYFHLSIRTHSTNKRCLQCYLNGSISHLHFTPESGVSQRGMPLSLGALTDCLLSCCSVDTIVWVSHVILFTGNLSRHEIRFITSVASPLSDVYPLSAISCWRVRFKHNYLQTYCLPVDWSYSKDRGVILLSCFLWRAINNHAHINPG